MLGGDDKQAVTLDQFGVGRGYADVARTPQARYDEMMVDQLGGLSDGLAVDGRIMHLIGGDIGLVGILTDGALHVGGSDESLAGHDNGQNDAYDAERIGDGARQRRSVGRQTELLQGLLGRAERWGIGGSARYDAHHVGHRDAESESHGHSQQGAQRHQSKAKHVELHSARAERAEEARAHLQAELVDEKHQAEALGVEQHLMVDRQPEVTCKNAGEKHPCDAQGDAADLDLSKTETYRYDQREHYHGLQGRMLEYRAFKPFHDYSGRQ